MPTARYGPAAAALGGKVYVFGGSGAGSTYLNTVEEFVPGPAVYLLFKSP